MTNAIVTLASRLARYVDLIVSRDRGSALATAWVDAVISGEFVALEQDLVTELNLTHAGELENMVFDILTERALRIARYVELTRLRELDAFGSEWTNALNSGEFASLESELIMELSLAHAGELNMYTVRADWTRDLPAGHAWRWNQTPLHCGIMHGVSAEGALSAKPNWRWSSDNLDARIWLRHP